MLSSTGVEEQIQETIFGPHRAHGFLSRYMRADSDFNIGDKTAECNLCGHACSLSSRGNDWRAALKHKLQCPEIQ